jgi:hypothetical protein
MIPDNEEEEDFGKMIEKEDKSTSSAPSETANNLMNEVFDTLLKEDINGREF